jgi:D-mannonate dehydratase
MYENNERDALEHIKAAGGVTKIVRHPFHTKDLLYTILDVITTQRKVEETFRSLTKKKIISSKYPFMPIFDNPTAAAAVAANEHEVKESVERTVRRTIRANDHESVRSGTVASSLISAHEQRVEELEDGTDCSSLLPEFVKRIRKQHPELNSPYRQERLREAADAENQEEDRLQAEAAERSAWRARLASKDTRDDGSLDSSVGGDRGDELLTKEDAVMLADSK